MNIKEGKLFYNKLLKLEKEKHWKMLVDITDRTTSPYKKMFKLNSLMQGSSEVIDIDLYSSKEWPSKSIVSCALSPNGTKIAFAITDFEYRDKKVLHALHIISIGDNKIKTPLIPKPSPSIGSICWSPDCKKIFFVAIPQKKKNTSVAKLEHYYSLSVLDLSTENIGSLAEIEAFSINSQSISPDGSEIVLSTNKKEIFIYNLNKEKLRKITDGMWPTWSPTDKVIAFYGLDENYYLINSDGSGKHMLIKNVPITRKFKLFGESVNKIFGELLWSPDAQYIYFERAAVNSIFEDTEHYVPYIMELSTEKEIRLPKEFTPGVKSWVGYR